MSRDNSKDFFTLSTDNKRIIEGIRIPSERLRSLTEFKAFLHAYEYTQAQFFDLSYENPNDHSYCVLQDTNDLLEWVENGMPKLFIEPSVVDDAISKIKSFWGNLMGHTPSISEPSGDIPDQTEALLEHEDDGFFNADNDDE